MNARDVALDDGPDIALDRPLVVVGRDPLCDTRLGVIPRARTWLWARVSTRAGGSLAFGLSFALAPCAGAWE
jgi:hypothetical protein